MKKGVVSLAAVLMVLASMATPSYAGKLGGLGNTTTYTGQNFTATYAVGDGVVGGSVPATLTIRVNGDATETSRRQVGLRLEALGQSRSTFIALPVNKAKTMSKSFAVPDRMQPGTYEVVFSVQVGDEFKAFSVPVTISAR